MDRRAFISVLGGAVLAVPLAAEAQPGLGVPRIGYLSINLASEISSEPLSCRDCEISATSKAKASSSNTEMPRESPSGSPPIGPSRT
jgi:hypothetical protein